jgi:predicted ArsR family transcriptional regulator
VATPEPIPDEVKRFVLTGVPSVPYLEAILLFRRTSGELSVDDIANQLYIPTALATEIADLLHRTGIVEFNGSQYRYAPRPALSTLLDNVASSYQHHLVAITNMIHASSGKNARHFADAFKLRRDR